MKLRRIILRILLASLGAAAAMGVLAVLIPQFDIADRAAWTGVLTALLAGVAMGMTKFMDRDATRVAGLTGVAVVIVEFLLWLAYIWLEPVLRWQLSQPIVAMAGFMIPLGGGVIGAVALLRWKFSRVAGIVGCASAAAAIIALVSASWYEVVITNSRWQTEMSLWSTGWSIASAGLLATAALVGLFGGERQWLNIIGAVASAVALLVSLVAIWDDATDTIVVAAWSLAAFAAYMNLALLAPLREGQSWVRFGSIAAAAVCAVSFVIMMYHDEFGDQSNDFLERLSAASGIVSACGAMALLVLMALNRRANAGFLAEGESAVELTCPRCKLSQELPNGDSACRSCGLRFHIRVEEPRCPECEYLLYDLASDRCPECGTLIRRPVDEPAATAPSS
ncbi:MAG: zinc ribbon domain-containing protein [Phycisphaerales bacterium]